MIHIGIIGGGASGIMAAIKASNEKASVTILERKNQIGKKLLATGNGRCNFTNKNMSSSCYYSDDEAFVKDTLERFSKDDLLSFFNEAGVLCKEKNGYYYPASEQSSTILDALKYELKEREVIIETDCDVTKIEKINNRFVVMTSDNRSFEFDKVIISTGGKAGLPKGERANGYNLLKAFGINYTKLYPALTSLSCKGFNFKGVSGVRSECFISLYENGNEIMRDCGEVLFNDTGISGIVTFQLSHAALESVGNGNDVRVYVDLLPGLSESNIKAFVSTKLLLHPELNIDEFFTGIHNKKLCHEILKMNSINLEDSIDSLSFDELINTVLCFKKLEFTVTNEASYDKAQVTGGGISLDEVTSSFELKAVPGLYVTGELLNVDGICGGYNLQWAFSSGCIAGESAANII